MKLRISKAKIKIPKIPKPKMFEDESYLRCQRICIVYGLPLLIAGFMTHFFMNPQLPLKSVMWGSALSSASYIMAVSMIRSGTKSFWLLFSYFFLSGTLQLFIHHGSHGFETWVEKNSFICFLFSFGIFPILYFIYSGIFTEADQEKVISKFRFSKKIRLLKKKLKA